MKLSIVWFDKIKPKDRSSFLVELAEIISTIFDPFLITLLFLALLLNNLALPILESLKWFFFVLIVTILPPVLYILKGLKTGEIHDWFISERKERYKVLALSLVSLSILNLALSFLKAPEVLQVFSFSALILGGVLSITTLFWKISFHLSFYTFFATLMTGLYGPNQIWFYLPLPLIGWSRNKLGKHTWTQIVAGTSVSWVVTILVVKWYTKA